jgi:hypothetical protein
MFMHKKFKLFRFNKVKHWLAKHEHLWHAGLIIVAVGLIAWTGSVAYRVDGAIVRTDPSTTANSKPVIEFLTSPLTGKKVAPDLAERAVYAVMIENSPDARPQSALSQAGVVFEAIAEGGITRFLTLFQETSPEKIGPVRSLRPYYIDWLLGFDPAVLHVGGSTEARAMIPTYGVKSLDTVGAYYRTSDRYAPHNAYSSYDRVSSLMKKNGYTSSKFTPFLRGEPTPVETPKATTITVNISSALYNISYKYDAGCNCYKRNLAGEPHKDRETGAQLSPDVVIVLKTPHSFAVDSANHTVIETIGTGEALIFQNGDAIKSTWKKSSRTAQITFTDVNDKVVALNPGQTWITVMPPERSVTFTP